MKLEIHRNACYKLDTSAFDPAQEGLCRNRLSCRLAHHGRDIADKRKFISNIYYVRDYSVTGGRHSYLRALPIRSVVARWHIRPPSR